MNLFERYIGKNEHSVNVNLPVISASLFVIIPCYNEPGILKTINSLSQCCPPDSRVAVLIVINSSEDSPNEVLSQNLLTLLDIELWKHTNANSFLDVHVILAHNLSRKYAGVGWARKIGMDEAVKQISQTNQEDGILISFDADSTVSPEYLRSIEQSFNENPSYNFFTIDFAHQPENNQSSEGILRYELHMRYYRKAMEWCGYPHAIHTVGSSFAVRASAYVKQGGMNRRKAGEDFYFLHKMVLLGNYGNICSATVFPSARESDRVPFGTGAALKKWSEGSADLMTTYSLDAFIILKHFFSDPSSFSGKNEAELKQIFDQYPAVLQRYIEDSGVIKEILELQNNCSAPEIFTKRFFHRINAFWILKFLNYSHENFFSRGELFAESTRLLRLLNMKIPNDISPEQLLEIYRSLDKEK